LLCENKYRSNEKVSLFFFLIEEHVYLTSAGDLCN